MQPFSDPRQWFIISDLKHTAGRLDSVTDAPPGEEGVRQRGIEEVDRHRVVENPAHPRRRHRPAVSAAVLVQPSGYLGIALTKTPWWNADPDANGEPALGNRDHVARVPWHSAFLICSH